MSAPWTSQQSNRICSGPAESPCYDFAIILLLFDSLSYKRVQMQQSRVSVRGQTVIPSGIRRELGISPNDLLDWRVQDGIIIVQPLPKDPLRASLGILVGRGSVDEFLADRANDRR